MSDASEAPTEAPRGPNRRPVHKRVAVLIPAIIVAYVAITYLLVPLIWETYFRKHPSLDDVPGVTQTTTGIPGDPVNVALIGTKQQVVEILQAAKWYSADPLSLRSDVEIAAATVLDRPYEAAPVSSLYLFGRKEDLAFEKPMGNSPQHRNHVRFWKSDKTDPDGRPMWMGSASYDKSVGLSHTTGEITHHIAPDVDTERDRLFADLEQTGRLVESYNETGFHKVLSGKNGGGDPWETDGDLRVGIIERGPKPTE
jgi:hypothetical protein